MHAVSIVTLKLNNIVGKGRHVTKYYYKHLL